MASRHLFASKFTVLVMACVAAGALASGCGAENPFQRGLPTGSSGAQQEVEPGGETKVSAKDLFLTKLRPQLEVSCKDCHDGSFLSDSAEADYAAAKALITPGNADGSTMYQKVQGNDGHGGGPVWSSGDASLIELKSWIENES